MNSPPFSEPPPSSEPPPASKLSPPAKQVPFSEQQVRDDLVNYARSLFQRGLSSGGSGNISVKLPDGSFLVTPTNSCLGELDSQTLSKLDAEGNHISGDKPSKEVPMHLAMYRARSTCGAVVHLHSPYLTALSCLTNIDHTNCLPPHYTLLCDAHRASSFVVLYETRRSGHCHRPCRYRTRSQCRFAGEPWPGCQWFNAARSGVQR